MNYQITVLNYVPMKFFHIQCISLEPSNPSVLTFHTFKGSELYRKLLTYLEATIGELRAASDYCGILDEEMITFRLDINVRELPDHPFKK